MGERAKHSDTENWPVLDSSTELMHENRVRSSEARGYPNSARARRSGRRG